MRINESPCGLRILALLILLLLPLAIVAASIKIAANEGAFDDFGGQLRDLVTMVRTGRRP